MTGIEIIAVAMIGISFVSAFLNFFPHWAPKNETLASAYKAFSSVPMALGLFLGAMVLLFVLG